MSKEGNDQNILTIITIVEKENLRWHQWISQEILELLYNNLQKIKVQNKGKLDL